MDDIQSWEQSLIGTVLGDQKLAAEVGDILPADMSSDQHKIIWATCLDLAKRGGLGHQSLINSLKAKGALDSIGIEDAQGEQYVFYLLAMGDPATLGEFGRNVRNASDKRKLIELSAYVNLQAKKIGTLATEIIDWFAQEMLKVRRDTSDPVLIGSLNPGYEERAKLIRAGEKVPFWEPPLEPLKKVIGHLNSTDYVLVVGEPGTGKSSLLRYLALETAMRGDGVLVLPFENSKEEYHSWAIAHIAVMNHFWVEDPRGLNQTQLDIIEEAKQKLEEIPYYIRQMASENMTQLSSIIRRHVITHPDTTLIVVDGTYLISGHEEDYRRISNIQQSLRTLSQELNIPIIGSTQFKKGKEGDKKELKDLFYAGEKEARGVWMIEKGKVSDLELLELPFNKKNGKLVTLKGGELNSLVVRINIKKNTNGNTGLTEPIVWVKPTNTYAPFVQKYTGQTQPPKQVTEAIEEEDSLVAEPQYLLPPQGISKASQLVDNARKRKNGKSNGRYSGLREDS